MKYSATTNGFYDELVHGDNIPVDAVTISDEKYASLMEGQTAGKLIASDKDGNPVLQDYPAPTAQQLQAAKNREARAYLASTDWYVVRKAETGEAIPQDILDARAAARLSVVE